MLNDIIQFTILLSSASVAWLVTQPNNKHKLIGFYIGLFSQPFWFYSSFSSGQWGIFVLCFFYSYSWIKGIIKHR